MDSSTKMRFPALCRDYRVAAKLRQREVANALGIATSSYGNVESVNRKTLSRDRAEQLANFYKLDEAARTDLLAAWDEMPVSEYSQRQADAYAARRAQRSKAREADRLKTALLEVVGLLISSVDDPGKLCACQAAQIFDFSQGDTPAPCELCSALQLVGVSGGWTTHEEVVAKLAELQESST
jgi:transcriptional regulator with XRE-family HTH domain